MYHVHLTQDYHNPHSYPAAVSDLNKYYRGVLEEASVAQQSQHEMEVCRLEREKQTGERLAGGYKSLHDDLLIKIRLLSEQNEHLERDLRHSQQEIMHLRTHLKDAEGQLQAVRGNLSSYSSEINHLRSFNMALDSADNRLRNEFDVSVTEHQRRMNELLERCNTLQAMKDRDDAQHALQIREFEKVDYNSSTRSSEI
jgi:chromosome segregation ATPase